MAEDIRFNIRVYGLLMRNSREVLVSDECRFGVMMTKFPGGGLKPGEGVLDCLRREWKEELEVELKSAQLLYTPSGYIQSAFRATDQIVPLYFQVEVPDLGALRVSEVAFDFESGVDESQSFRWVDIFELAPTYPGDQEVVAFLRALKS